MIKTGFWGFVLCFECGGVLTRGTVAVALALGLGCSRAGSPGAGRGGAARTPGSSFHSCVRWSRAWDTRLVLCSFFLPSRQASQCDPSTSASRHRSARAGEPRAGLPARLLQPGGGRSALGRGQRRRKRSGLALPRDYCSPHSSPGRCRFLPRALRSSQRLSVVVVWTFDIVSLSFKKKKKRSDC